MPNMKKCSWILCVVCLPPVVRTVEAQVPPLPAPVSNNAVASLKIGKHEVLFSFMGIGVKKTWDSITNATFRLDPSNEKWTELRPVPGPAGRLGASAIGAREQIFLLGGYVLDRQDGEITVRDVSVYEPEAQRWYRGADLPIPIDDSVVGVFRDRYLYVVSGWSNKDAVANVQVYDIEKDKWQQATSIPGTPVFGHAGGVVDDTMVYVDGARKNPSGTPPYVASDECWMGKIDHKDITKIQWSKLPAHPGTARYRIAAGASEKDHRIYFSGGTDNPYNYNGIGYDGRPAEPSPLTFAFDARSGKWETVTDKTAEPTMDHRGLLVTRNSLIILGGMEKGQQVTAKVQVIPRK
jgi:N-acetylneuraminic acid mutarotase